MKKGFSNNQYVEMQSKYILERIEKFDNKLYLEFGGKLFDDLHASRVLPGFESDAKVRLLQKLSDKTEIIIAINAGDIERKKIRADYGITYDMDVLRLIDNLRFRGLYVSAVIITQYKGQPSADIFRKKLEIKGERVFIHKNIKGYPNSVDTIVSDEGYGANDYVPTTRPLVVVTAPGPGSGKLATCLTQLYHEYKRNIKAGYAKFETFPIWNLPLKHPVNIAYEAATADLKDVNMIDPFHLDAYGITTVNYNRDIEVFPIVKTILNKITNDNCSYNSPTDMGVNMAGYAIVDDEAVKFAAKQEIIRRYYKTWCDYKNGMVDIEVAQRVEMLMREVGVSLDDRKVVKPALQKAESCKVAVFSIELENGEIVTGKSTSLMEASASAVVNTIKKISGIADEIHLLSPIVIEPIISLKCNVLGSKSYILSLEDVLVALSISAATNPTVALAMTKLTELRGCEAHSTIMLSQNDEDILRRLGIYVTCEAEFISTDLYTK